MSGIGGGSPGEQSLLPVSLKKDLVDKVLYWSSVVTKKYPSSSSSSKGWDRRGSLEKNIEHVDTYGFVSEIDGQDQECLDACLQREIANESVWKNALGAAADVLCRVDPHVLKKMCRGGVPPSLRKRVWLYLSGADEVRKGAHDVGMTYMLYIERGKCLREVCKRQIDLDCPRTFPNNTWVQSDVGQVSLQRVLYAFAGENRSIGYCQGMNYVAAMLLLVLEYDEEAAFWILCRLVGHDRQEGILYHDLYASTLSGCHVEMRSLDDLVDQKLPRLAKHMKFLNCDMSILSTEWFLCLYSTSLPAETAARVWDALFSEGPKVLYRVGLALLVLHEDILLETENAGELLKAMRGAVSHEYDRDQLLHVAFEGIGPLPMSKIQKIRHKKQIIVDKEIALRSTREKLRMAVQEHGHVLMEGEADFLAAQEEVLHKQLEDTTHDSSSLLPGKGAIRNLFFSKQ